MIEVTTSPGYSLGCDKPEGLCGGSLEALEPNTLGAQRTRIARCTPRKTTDEWADQYIGWTEAEAESDEFCSKIIGKPQAVVLPPIASETQSAPDLVG